VFIVVNNITGSGKISKYSLFAKRIGLVGVAQAVASLQGLILLPIMTKTFGAAGYGIWAQILITILLVQPFIMLGLDSAILRFLSSKDKKEIGQGFITVLSIVLITGFFASVILFLSSDFLAITLLREESAGAIFRIASPLLLLGALNTVTLGSFRVFGQIKRYAVIVLLQTILEVGLISFFVLSGYGLRGAVVSLLITRTITLLVGLIFVFSHAGFSRPNFSMIRPYLSYGLPLVPTVIFGFIVSSSDRYVIGFFLGAEKVGVYSAAYGIGSVILMFSAYIMYILRPTVYNSFDKKKDDEVKTYLSYSLKYLLLFSIPSVFGLFILAKSLLTNLTTTEFISEGELIIPIVAISIVYHGAATVFGTVILLYKRSKLFVGVFGLAAVLNLGLNIIFVPQWGVIGAAITTLIAYYLLAIIVWYLSYKQMKFKIQVGFIAKAIFASVVSTFVIWLFTPTEIIELIAAILLFVTIYFALLFLLRGFGEKELGIIREIIGFGKRGSDKYSFKKSIIRFISKRRGTASHSEYSKFNSLNDEVKLSDFQEKHLKKLLLHAYKNVPYYTHVFEKIGLINDGNVDLSKFNKIPILTKDIIRKHYAELISKDHTDRKWYYKESGGSTGEPIKILQDDVYVRWRNAAEHYYYANILNIDEIGSKKVIIWGSWSDLFQGTKGIKAKISSWLKNSKLLNCLKMTEDDIERYIKIINSYKPKLIRGYSSSLYELCRYAENNKLKVFTPKAIVGTAETLTPEMRKQIETVFGTKLYNFYGAREVSSIAGECKEGLMHIFSFYNHVEILDGKNKPAKKGEEGRVIVTNLYNYSMPIIRFEIGDVAVLGSKKCKCGNLLPVLERITGRITEWFVKEDGTTISPVFFIILFMGVYEKRLFKKFQIIQEDYKKIRILIVPENGKKMSHKKDIEEKIKHLMGKDCNIKWEYVDDIPKTKSGKYVFVKSLVWGQK